MHLLTLFVCALVLIPAHVNAHTYLSSVTINDVKQTACLRPLNNNGPISSVTSPDMMCGFLPKGTTPAASKCAVNAGDKVGLQWSQNTPPDASVVDASHKGPCLVYLSRDNGATWFKIYEYGYDTTLNQFCVTTLIANNGYMEFTIPVDIAPGNYLMRAELIALHQAENIGGSQPYVDCTELTISGKGTATPSGVPIPGAYTDTDPGILFNLYATPMATYVIPGPNVYVATSNSGGGGGGGDDHDTSNSGGLSSGGAAALAIILIAVTGVVAGGVYYYKKNGHLFLRKTTNGEGTNTRKNGDYMQYTDTL